MDTNFALSLEGFTNAAALEWLNHNAYGHCLEIGTYGGRSAYAIASSPKTHSLICIDRWEDYSNVRDYPINSKSTGLPSFNRMLLANLGLRIVPINGDSITYSYLIEDKSLDFIFIDGDHSYDGLVGDLNLYIPKLKHDALLVGDDYNLSEVRAALASLNMGVTLVPGTALWYCHLDY